MFSPRNVYTYLCVCYGDYIVSSVVMNPARSGVQKKCDMFPHKQSNIYISVSMGYFIMRVIEDIITATFANINSSLEMI